MQDRYTDAVDWVDRALNLPGADDDRALRARALCIKGWSLWPLGRASDQAAVFNETEAAARETGDPVMVSRALQLLASRAGSADLLDVAAAHAAEALELATEAADDWAIALASFAHAMASSTMVDLRERTEQAATRLARAGNAYHLADLLSSAAYGAICMDSDRDAKAFVDRARPVTRGSTIATSG